MSELLGIERMYSRVLPLTSMLARPLVSPAGLPQPALGMTSVLPAEAPPPMPAPPVVPPRPAAPLEDPPLPPRPAGPVVPAAPVVPADPDVPAAPAGDPPPVPVDEPPEPPQDRASENVATASTARPEGRRLTSTVPPSDERTIPRP